MPKERNMWIVDQEKTIIKVPILELVERDCHSSENGHKHRFYVMKSRNWANIIPITEDGKVVMVKQFRAGIDQHTLEIPGGVVDPEDPHPRDTAIREMTEETGYVPVERARAKDLEWCFPNPAIINNRCYFFVIGPVRKDREQNLDSGEMIEVVEVPVQEIPKKIRSGEITHALTLTALFYLGLSSNVGAESLVKELQAFTRG